MKSFRTIERRIEKEIMNTDILVRIASDEASKEEMIQSVEKAFQLMRQFAQRYSRFIKGNELWRFNQSAGGPVSQELLDLLQRATAHHQETDGKFDPSVLPSLEHEGYTGAYSDGLDHATSVPFSSLVLDPIARRATKPLELKIDFGGFGKGYIVDRVTEFLSRTHPHVLVDAGGDIATRGGDVGRGESHWIIGVENPAQIDGPELCLLSLSGEAVATSGTNRRKWRSNEGAKHHLIDPETRRSSESTFLSVTVIAPSAETADVLAKTLFLLGEGTAQQYATDRELPAIFCSVNGNFEINHFAQPYVYSLV